MGRPRAERPLHGVDFVDRGGDPLRNPYSNLATANLGATGPSTPHISPDKFFILNFPSFLLSAGCPTDGFMAIRAHVSY